MPLVVESSVAVNVPVQVILSELVNVPSVPPTTVTSSFAKPPLTASENVIVTVDVLVGIAQRSFSDSQLLPLD